METFVPFASGAWRGYCSADWQEIFRDLETWLQENPGEMVVHYPCRDVRRIATPRGTIYSKYIRALTDKGLVRKEWFSYLKWVLRPSRAVGAWRAAVAMAAAGLDCPVPILAARKREKGYPTDIIVTPEVPFPDCWNLLPGETPAQVAKTVAHAAALLHVRDFAHGDFILRNLCLDTNTNRIVYLDNDRTWLPPCFVRHHYQRRNLAQMAYSLATKYNDLEPVRLFLKDYADEAGWPSAGDQRRLLRITQRRYNYDPRRPPLDLPEER